VRTGDGDICSPEMEIQVWVICGGKGDDEDGEKDDEKIQQIFVQ
jgi:hypothetical protein